MHRSSSTCQRTAVVMICLSIFSFDFNFSCSFALGFQCTRALLQLQSTVNGYQSTKFLQRLGGQGDRQKHFSSQENIEDTSIDVNRFNGAVSQFVGFSEVNLLYGIRTLLVYDETQDLFVNRGRQDENAHDASVSSSKRIYLALFQTMLAQLRVSFVPAGVTQNYYAFMRWRIIQRFVNANLHVFGTQSLLLGLGIKAQMNSRMGALSAALNWVLKDALGKIVRMIWASRMGLRFDGDAKRWRFRSSFVFAAGNGLEIATYIFPNMFLIWATLANCCKQISMLTSSSTRPSIFNSFRDGTRENIADITAKGEAQIAIVELFGIASGICLSRFVGMSVRNIVIIYSLLQALEIACVYAEMRQVEYRVCNFERLVTVIQSSLESLDKNVLSPHEVALSERMFRPPKHLSRRRVMFGSLGRSKLSPSELDHLLKISGRNRFLLVVGSNVKRPHTRFNRFIWKSKRSLSIQEKCHVVLHSSATNSDIVKGTLALLLLRRKLASIADRLIDIEKIRTSDVMDLIEESVEESDVMFDLLLRKMNEQGWESPTKLIFARVNMRADWPLSEVTSNSYL